MGEQKNIALYRFFPFIRTIKKYNFGKLKRDVIAAMTVAILALPQCMAYAMIAGVHPKYGLYAAIFPIMLSSLFGSSRFLIAGPTNAISMVISSTIASASVGGIMLSAMPEEQKMKMIFLLAFLVGVIRLSLGLARMGVLVNFVSQSVVVGYITGAGILIAFNQVKNFLGLSKMPATQTFVDTLKQIYLHLPETSLAALSIAVFTILFILATKKISKKFPGPLVAMILSGLIVFFLGLKVKTIGDIPRTMPPFSSFPLDIVTVKELFMSAMAIAILGMVEALSIAKSIANSSGERIDCNQELVGQGISNIVASFTSSIPGSGSLTRSMVNYVSNAASRFSGVFTGLFVLITLLVFGPYAKYIPVASLAGILMLIAYSMVDQKAVALAYKSTRSDRIVLISTVLATLFLELEIAVYVGILLSIALFLRKVSHPQVAKVAPRKLDNKMYPHKPGERYCPQITIFDIDGSLFFGAIEELDSKIQKHRSHDGVEKVYLLRMRGVHVADGTAMHFLSKFLKECKSRNIRVIFTNVCDNVFKTFKDSGILDEIGTDNITEDTTIAIKMAVEKYADHNYCKTCPWKVFEECKKL